ncbi:hypothetical protein FHS82_000992 [Pseudochelatococcus lubricantis]|uniref:Uncharacterized protein n=1 Tax=Pseudochelatococcus lubricantis TaxID=1538102 RepID=A0ABX0UW35_9HYPH|nr:hypothetical protein [Pseudochelatococcus lubricantis]NIJ57166.1 hypothetical protein [Pseudochelatococcus lubricantis]
MTTEDRKAFEEWQASEPSLIRTPSYDATAELAWQAATAYATARERERCAALVEAGLGRTNTSIARSIRFPGSVVAHETTTSSVVDHKSGNMQHKPEPPGELVERAREFWGRERNPWPGTFRVLAAFAEEYAAKQTREWSARALIAEVRAEAAEKALARIDGIIADHDEWTRDQADTISLIRAAAIRARKGDTHD